MNQRAWLSPTTIYFVIAFACIALAIMVLGDGVVLKYDRAASKYHFALDWPGAVVAVALLLTACVSLVCSVVVIREPRNEDLAP